MKSNCIEHKVRKLFAGHVLISQNIVEDIVYDDKCGIRFVYNGSTMTISYAELKNRLAVHSKSLAELSRFGYSLDNGVNFKWEPDGNRDELQLDLFTQNSSAG